MNRPSSTITAAGVGGLLAGVPIGSYLGGLTAGIINVKWPEIYAGIAQVTDVTAAIGGIYTVLIAFVIGYVKKENVLPLREEQ